MEKSVNQKKEEESDKMKSQIWVTEESDFLRQSYQIKRTLFSGQSPFQSVDIVETGAHGKMLLNDGLVMISEKDEFIYHEMIAHIPLHVYPDAKKVLVIGGGDGGSAREVLRHETIQKCVMVEIDEMVVNACKEHIPLTASCLEGHPKLDLKIEDAVKYVAESKEVFDLIIVDSTDPIGPAKPLFGEAFYRNVYNRLGDNGIVVSQCGSPHYGLEAVESMLKILKALFPVTQLYTFTNLTYPGGLWSFSFASKGLHPIKDLRRQTLSDMKYYNSEVHRAAFAHPEFIKRRLGEYFS